MFNGSFEFQHSGWTFIYYLTLGSVLYGTITMWYYVLMLSAQVFHLFFIVMCICFYVYICHILLGVWRIEERILVLLEWELHAVVSCLTWVLRNELGHLEKPKVFLFTEASVHPHIYASLFHLILHAWVFCLHVCLCIACIKCLKSPEECVRSPGTGGIDSYEPPCRYWK